MSGGDSNTTITETMVDIVKARLADGRAISDIQVHGLLHEIERLRGLLRQIARCDPLADFTGGGGYNGDLYYKDFEGKIRRRPGK